jgi:hypothetical protein
MRSTLSEDWNCEGAMDAKIFASDPKQKLRGLGVQAVSSS